MLQWSPLLLLGMVLLLTGCTALDEEITFENFVPLSELPADYGELVTVLHYQEGDLPPSWDEMWFENEETGTLVLVPVHRSTWSYDPTRVRLITRTAANAATGR